MSAPAPRAIDRFLGGFIVAGVILITASWLITGENTVAFGLAPLLLLWLVQFGARADAAKGPGDDR